MYLKGLEFCQKVSLGYPVPFKETDEVMYVPFIRAQEYFRSLLESKVTPQEFQRLKDELLLSQDDAEPESHLRRALEVARGQEARSLELVYEMLAAEVAKNDFKPARKKALLLWLTSRFNQAVQRYFNAVDEDAPIETMVSQQQQYQQQQQVSLIAGDLPTPARRQPGHKFSAARIGTGK